MAKNIEDIISYEPADALIFEGPFDKPIKRNLVLRNLVGKDMAYKMKTTSPRLFFVRPNIGILMANSSINIEIFMQPACSRRSPSDKRHKFLIVAAEATDDIGDLQDFFKMLDPANMWEGKVRCDLLHPQTEINDTINELDETIRHVAGGVVAQVAEVEMLSEESERSYDALEGHELEELKMMKEKVANLEKERLNLDQEMEDIRNAAKNKQKFKKIGIYNRSNILLIATVLSIGAVLLATKYGNYVQQLIKQVF
ncbi:vesicle-associated membrane protein-associated protein B/C [Drosophila obscura]|uniref:vesicle-associated membrane protein-associated protein B/C n=1 Tax=Drosophila obscura TaxID=7282 RepID=UPI001BB1E325|nr:vesicle-associated membrane protein-associated protein B/C [Drosophila obscura]